MDPRSAAPDEVSTIAQGVLAVQRVDTAFFCEELDIPTLFCEATRGVSLIMSWSSLPNDVVELILAKLSVVELARLSPTCSSFQALYRQQMAVQQKSRLDLAMNLCGQERIACIVALIAHLLLGRPLRQDFWFHEWKISADGVLHRRGPDPAGSVPTIETGDVWFGHSGEAAYRVLIRFPCLGAEMWNSPELRAEIHRRGITITLCPSHDGDLQPVAMVQALLSGGLAQFLHHTGKWSMIDIWQSSADVTDAGLKALIIPLLPFASRYSPAERPWRYSGYCTGERMLVGGMESARPQEIALGLGGRAGGLVEAMPQYDSLRHIVPEGYVAREGRVGRVLRGWRSLLRRLTCGRQNP